MSSRRQPAPRFVIISLLLVALFFAYQHYGRDPPSLAISREPLTRTWMDDGAAKKTYRNIFAFGDSLTWTNQNTDVDMPTADNPFGTVYPGVTQAGGPNWLGFLWHDHMPESMVFNFAQGGAHVASGEFGDAEDRQNDVIRQVDLFLHKLQESRGLPSWRPESTLFAVWLGTNDIAGAYVRKIGSHIFDSILERMFKQIDRLVEIGAEEFLLMTPEPEHLVRLHGFGNPLNKPLQKLVYDWNDKLLRATEAWHRRTGKRVHLIDVSTMVEEALEAKVAKPCSSLEDELPHDECMWEDKFHLGSVANRMIADKARAVLLL